MKNETVGRIIVNNLNKLRWLYSNQSFTTNVLYPTTQVEFDELIKMLTDNQISFTIR